MKYKVFFAAVLATAVTMISTSGAMAQQRTPSKEQQRTATKEQQRTPTKEQQRTPSKGQQRTPTKEQRKRADTVRKDSRHSVVPVTKTKADTGGKPVKKH